MTCNDKYPVANNPDYKYDPPIIEDKVSVGSGAIILPGVRICTGAVIGAGAVVVRDVKPGETVIRYGKTLLERNFWEGEYGKALERQEDEPRQEESATSYKDSPAFFDLQDHFQKEK